MKKYKILPLTILLVLSIFFQSFSPEQRRKSTPPLPDFDGYTNQQYATYLENDGWPVELLNTGHDAEWLSDEEKNLVLAMNLVRHDPPKYARLYVEPRLQYFDGTLYQAPGKIAIRTREGEAVVKELYRELLKVKPLPVFVPSRGMSKGSADHAKYLKRTGLMTHDGQGGMSARVSRYGEWQGGLAENLQWGTSNAHEAIMSLMVDDGVRDRGHRINMLEPAFKKVGVAVADHPNMRISYVINFANGFVEK